ncbi:palmitoyltransferase [Nematocida displodere]|uniref:Palmitoyltransferase n=1 Tax=Nematocida displodere TaxID=1805483 RepID=A0A177EJV4_9MICR|nr:palmitoyltransferase [Nematocida displodere]
MHFYNRRFEDCVGLSISYTLIFYFGAVSNPILFWEDIQEERAIRGAVIFINCALVLIFGLLFKVSNTRGYLEAKEYRVGARFCYDCRQSKAERAHHCSRCKKCVKKMDHHCPWIGSCVNADNFGNFTKLLGTVFITSLVGLGLYSVKFHRLLRVMVGITSASWQLAVVAANIIALVSIALIIIVLLVRQTRLMLSNLTYVEWLHVRKLDRLDMVCPKNPYDKGSRGNMYEVFGSPLDFILCRMPPSQDSIKYSNYWPPIRLTKNDSIRSSTTALNNTTDSGWGGA